MSNGVVLAEAARQEALAMYHGNLYASKSVLLATLQDVGHGKSGRKEMLGGCMFPTRMTWWLRPRKYVIMDGSCGDGLYILRNCRWLSAQAHYI